MVYYPCEVIGVRCENCGAVIKDGEKRCPNCGSFCDSDGYILLSENDCYQDYSIDEVPNKSKKIISIITMLLIVAIAAGGVFYYICLYTKPDDRPALELTSGAGIINEDEPVIYVSVPEDSQIEFIHGVRLYDYDLQSAESKAKPVSTDYEYTKSIDEVFRTIFFDTEDFGLEDDKTYTYTIQFDVSFLGSNQIYTYSQPITFSGKITDDAADIVFDHSMVK